MSTPSTHAITQLFVVWTNGALLALEKLDSHQSPVAEMRFFAELSRDQTAEALEVSVGTARRE